MQKCNLLRLLVSLFVNFFRFHDHRQAALSNWSITPASENVCVHSCKLNFLIPTFSPFFFEKHLLLLSKKMKMCVNAHYFVATSFIIEVFNVLLKHYWAQYTLTYPHNHLSSFEYFAIYLLSF